MRVIRSLGKAFIAAVVGAAAFAQAPSGLTAKAATNKRVDLAWSGTSAAYTVQRRVLGSGAYSSVASSVTSTGYSDTSIDPYTTYQYQVIANLSSGASSPSNAITVGPPPSGFTTPSPAPGPAGGPASANYGYNLSATLDGNGDPAFAFIFYDPNLDSDGSDTRLEFRSWNRAAYKWNDIAHVITNMGDTGTTFHEVLSLAYDFSTNTFGIASEENSGNNLLLYFSTDGGTTWTKKTTFTNQNYASSPSMAFYNGTIHLAYVVDSVGLKYVTGKLTSDPSTWQTKSEIKVSGIDRALADTTISLALDSNGNPAVAWFANDLVHDYNVILQFWKPLGGGGPVKVLDSRNQQSDTAVKLVFTGLNPRMLVQVERLDSIESGLNVRSVKSDDGGTTWAAPVQLPPDGYRSSNYPFDLAIDSQGHAAAPPGV